MIDFQREDCVVQGLTARPWLRPVSLSRLWVLLHHCSLERLEHQAAAQVQVQLRRTKMLKHASGRENPSLPVKQEIQQGHAASR